MHLSKNQNEAVAKVFLSSGELNILVHSRIGQIKRGCLDLLKQPLFVASPRLERESKV